MTSHGLHRPLEACLNTSKNSPFSYVINNQEEAKHLLRSKQKSGERRGLKRRRSYISSTANTASDSIDCSTDLAIKKSYPLDSVKMHLDDRGILLHSAINNGKKIFFNVL